MKLIIILTDKERDIMLDLVNLSRSETKYYIKENKREIKDYKTFLKMVGGIKQALKRGEKVKGRFEWLFFWRKKARIRD